MKSEFTLLVEPVTVAKEYKPNKPVSRSVSAASARYECMCLLALACMCVLIHLGLLAD